MEEKRNCRMCDKEYVARNWRSEVCSHECHLARRRKWHELNGDTVRAKGRSRYHNGGKAYYKSYERTPKGFLMRKYRNMQSRVLGIQKHKFHLYKHITGTKLLDRETFYEWAFANKTFLILYKQWVASGYERRLAPSVDRIDSNKGYVLSNMEWITHSENSRRGTASRERMKREKANEDIVRSHVKA